MSGPLAKKVRMIFLANPDVRIKDIAEEFAVPRTTVADWVRDIRARAQTIYYRGRNRRRQEVVAKGKVRRCLKCHQSFRVTENFYRCWQCRAED